MQHGTDDSPKHPQRPRPLWHRRLLCAAVLCGSLSGCVTPWEKSALMKDTSPSIDKVQGPSERRLRNLFWARRQDAAQDDSDSLKPIAGTEEYLAATDLYKSEEYAEAQKAFKSVAKKYKKSEIREDALFMQGEAAFQQEHYSKAHDLYAQLLKDYPSTRHLDVVSERLFKIGRIWLDFPEVATLSEIRQVNYEDPKRKLPADEPPPPNKTPVFVPNFRDKQRPTFDTPGNGVAALKAIWMNDPTGPLADDAMMLVASHHAREGNYIEADRYFAMLRETFPNSPHLQDAFLLGSHVKLMSYQGADYDGKTLADAQKLKESYVRLYPNSAESARLKDELARIEDAKAEREWQQVGLWLRKGNKRAAAVICHQLISDFPKSDQAGKAREKLETMGPEYLSGAVLLNPKDPPKPTLIQRIIPIPAITGEVQDPSRPRPTPKPQQKPADEKYDGDAEKEQSPSRWTPNPFRKRPAPTTDPVDKGSAAADSSAENNDKEATRKKSWLWPPPRRLPAETDDDARKLDAADTTGNAKL